MKLVYDFFKQAAIFVSPSVKPQVLLIPKPKPNIIIRLSFQNDTQRLSTWTMELEHCCRELSSPKASRQGYLLSYKYTSELLIWSLHEKIRKIPGPRNNRHELILEFDLAVQNFADHLQATEQEGQLSNPKLIQADTAVRKTSGPMRMDWAVTAQRFRAVAGGSNWRYHRDVSPNKAVRG